jgi:glycosyltransferase involved in cell wall biosynthesis
LIVLCHEDQSIEAPGAEILAVPPMSRWREFLWVQTTLPRILRSRRVDVYHAMKHTGPFFPGCACVIGLHEVGQYVEQRTDPLVQYVYWRYVQPFALRRANRVIANSDWARDVAVSKVGVKKNRVTVVPYGIDPVFEREPEDDELSQVRRKFNLPDRYLLAVGNINPKKNHATIVQALHRLAGTGFHTPELVIAGAEGFRAEEFFDLTRRLGLEDRVHCTGFVEPHTLALLYRGADILVYPSLYEAFGLPPIEAMACNTPVITTPRGAIPQVTGGFAWYLEDPTDAAGLADFIRQLLEDRDERQTRVVQARQWVRRYSWTSAAENTLAVYSEMSRS